MNPAAYNHIRQQLHNLRQTVDSLKARVSELENRPKPGRPRKVDQQEKSERAA